jgi:hypothetical protein
MQPLSAHLRGKVLGQAIRQGIDRKSILGQYTEICPKSTVRSLLAGSKPVCRRTFWPFYLPKQVWVPPHMKRIFPRWFSQDSEVGRIISRNYQKFASEWGPLLEHKCLGGLDHCLFGALGPGNFLSRLKSPHDSFIFSTDVEDEDKALLFYQDVVSSDGSQLLRVVSQEAE